MENITIQKVESPEANALPIFEAIGKQLDTVQQKAFELFERRGRELGHALDDWLKAEHDVFGWPAAEMTEQDGKYELDLTLPGFDANQVQVTVSPSEIIVHAAYKPEKKGAGYKILWTEFGPNDVYRRFKTPQAIDLDKVQATLDKGMLHVIAGKAAAPKPESIEIAAA